MPAVIGVSTKPGLSVTTATPAWMQPVPQALEEPVEPALGGAVDVVALPSAVAGHRADHRDAPAPRRLEPVGQRGEQRHRRDEVHLDGARALRRRWPGRGPGPAARRGRSAPRPARRTPARPARRPPRSAADRSTSSSAVSTAAAPRDPEVGGHRLEPIGVAAGEEQAGSVRGVDPGGFRGDGRRGADDRGPGRRLSRHAPAARRRRRTWDRGAA